MRNRAKYLKYRIILHILRIIHRLNLLNVFVFPFPFFFPSKDVLRINEKTRSD